MKKLINGQSIKEVRTIKSMYDGDSVNVLIGRKVYRLPAKEINKIVNEWMFRPIKKKKHTYLEAVCMWDEDPETCEKIK